VPYKYVDLGEGFQGARGNLAALQIKGGGKKIIDRNDAERVVYVVVDSIQACNAAVEEVKGLDHFSLFHNYRVRWYSHMGGMRFDQVKFGRGKHYPFLLCVRAHFLKFAFWCHR